MSWQERSSRNLSKSTARNRRRGGGERAFQSLLGEVCVELEIRSAFVDEHLFGELDLQVRGRLSLTPFHRDVTRDFQQVGVRVLHFAQIRSAEQPQIRLLRQVLDVDGYGNAPSQELDEASIPLLSPACEERPIGTYALPGRENDPSI